ncbi:Pkinase-domain-containing protein [Auricularia subglabra TFB-10046 SS5]|uniref:Pkinase-domain-containing protein n=1 Tax=Auricularia subglabra (strain TFB-10046 / SS5) TaxID=717982 RepID=J0WXW2_AURST|nr:Pkinase-domain-containing protein [Auricularia subglabra TFB-10046 SS5]
MALKLGYAFNRATTALADVAPRKTAFNDVQNNFQQPPTTPAKSRNPQPAAGQAAQADPPLPRQNSKTAPPSPPAIIRDLNRVHAFTRLGFLGEGGFARVYEALDARGGHHAIKVVTKTSLKTKKAKTKLYAEIKIHRSLDHPNIVRFRECFEDTENVYMTLELCDAGSLMDLLRRRKRFTEPEARFFMVQLIGACNYMHDNQVIHRDLKLGNLFLDKNMNVKVGDFGLAALIENPGERKKTICGTPNYIAPEVLFDTANGHSFEVDTWSNGVILYTLLVGKPPFQTKDVKTIYQRIKANDYEFPADRPINVDAKELIASILTPDPRERPSLENILDHRWFTHGIVPASIPKSALDYAPDFRHITPEVSRANFARLRRQCLLDEDQTTAANISTASARSKATSAAVLAQQERDFQKAVQPGSPISALLKSAREPLVVTNGERPKVDQPALGRRLATPHKSPLRAQTLANIQEEASDEVERGLPGRGRRELESQKARIVAQMAPDNGVAAVLGQENIPPPSRLSSKSSLQSLNGGKASVRSKRSEPAPPMPALPEIPRSPPAVEEVDTGGWATFEQMCKTLGQAFDAKDSGRLFRDPRLDADLPTTKVFIVSWVDYCNKYGMGYALTDGSVGVHFNDSTTLVLSPGKEHLDFMQPRKPGSTMLRKALRLSSYPEDMKNKVYLLKHFEKYMMTKLYGDYEYTFVDKERTHGMDFVQKYFRTKHVMLFQLSHDVLQFNFNDHSKMILAEGGLSVSHIDKEYRLTHWKLSELMVRAMEGAGGDPLEAKFNAKLLDKLRYCREVLRQVPSTAQQAKQR